MGDKLHKFFRSTVEAWIVEDLMEQVKRVTELNKLKSFFFLYEQIEIILFESREGSGTV